MPGFINGTTNVTIEILEDIVNVSNYPEFVIKVNENIYNGVFWFIMLCVLWIILFRAANKAKDQPLNNAMYSGALVSIVAFLSRAITATISGTKFSLINDHQLWIFPIITIILATIIWSIKD
ncbi:hypothetical protein LCGC14_0515090 [marine sediment metagenome]|uniref:Uncharacterized protein n=1 Tax=marine sediment metagenome TaxID=412755 RepID=A0A0F9V8D8_9ZZZZ